MDASDTDKVKTIRSKHNAFVLSKFRKGESLSQHSSMSSWFPPRPIVKKDFNAVEKLYNAHPLQKMSKPKEVPSKILRFSGKRFH